MSGGLGDEAGLGRTEKSVEARDVEEAWRTGCAFFDSPEPEEDDEDDLVGGGWDPDSTSR